MTPTRPGPGVGPRLRPMLLFGALTMLTFAGPMAIIVVGRGGDRPSWPPDRPVEWRVFLAVTIGFVGLFLACLVDAGLTLRRQRLEQTRSAGGRDEGRATEVEP